MKIDSVTIAIEIGNFFLDKFQKLNGNKNCYKYTNDFLRRINITNIRALNHQGEIIVLIDLTCVGIFIGKKNENINGLELWLKDKLGGKKVTIHPFEIETISDFLYVPNPEQDVTKSEKITNKYNRMIEDDEFWD